MPAKRSGSGSKADSSSDRPGTSVAPTKDPTNCEICGNKLGMWFSLADKAYCSPCFHSHFWTPFQSAPSKSR